MSRKYKPEPWRSVAINRPWPEASSRRRGRRSDSTPHARQPRRRTSRSGRTISTRICSSSPRFRCADASPTPKRTARRGFHPVTVRAHGPEAGRAQRIVLPAEQPDGRDARRGQWTGARERRQRRPASSRRAKPSANVARRARLDTAAWPTRTRAGRQGRRPREDQGQRPSTDLSQCREACGALFMFWNSFATSEALRMTIKG
jgi:hypothetical protein